MNAVTESLTFAIPTDWKVKDFAVPLVTNHLRKMDIGRRECDVGICNNHLKVTVAKSEVSRVIRSLKEAMNMTFVPDLRVASTTEDAA